jgi:hypothetical protein
MFELNLIYDTSQQTEIEPSVLLDNICNYVSKEYRIKTTDNNIAITLATSFKSRLKQFRTIYKGKFEVRDSKITLSYEINLLVPLIISIVAILLTITHLFGLLVFVALALQEVVRISVLYDTSQKMLKDITANTDLPITTKFKSIRFD